MINWLWLISNMMHKCIILYCAARSTSLRISKVGLVDRMAHTHRIQNWPHMWIINVMSDVCYKFYEKKRQQLFIYSIFFTLFYPFWFDS